MPGSGNGANGRVPHYCRPGETTHLHRDLAEFEFRYDRHAQLGWNDIDCANNAARRAEGKPLMHAAPIWLIFI
jgi:hypothetical protein